MDRRTFIGACAGGLVIARSAAEAQQTAKVPRLGYLPPNLAASAHLREAFRQGLHDLGYVEGRNVTLEYRDADGKLERLPSLAADLPVEQPTKFELVINLKTANTSASRFRSQCWRGRMR